MTVNYYLSTETENSDKIIDKNPIISVVVEGYNQSRDLGTVNDTLQALKKQTFPLKQVEIILVGSSIQTQGWEKIYRNDSDFLSIKTLSYDDANYYELKNGGANLANGDIVAFTDSDVCPKPSWLSAIAQGIAQGADVVVGPSLFRQPNGLSSDSPLLMVLSSVTWGWPVGKGNIYKDNLLQAAGFMDHNVAMKTVVFLKHQYRTEFGRIIASPLLYRSLANDGLNITYHSQQQACHFFSWKYWLISLHFRYGYEVYNIRRLDPQYPNHWISKTGILEPLVTMIWHILLDIPRWFRFSRHLGQSFPYRLACLPLLPILSTLGRGAEMVGMYATMINPEKMKKWAENV
ncbi:MAG: glycosyltransferase family 2 protein [Microcystis aeruginosa L111-01]|jgi:glycosyltransferase involved in cell wall biosynthesis|nr:glycosyltransferase family 2 protein [Microcystis aeruginosa SX13-11]NCR23507.1 glycosyltransferase family 2 protein [Microcystis aeruginosa L111-01]NCR88689.1 glycosyltransferase family 2 protein [Microcystis aeruginosa G13-10]NCS33034.1 glycosyltransferase family 2 protein [Microcystis aeruginosa G11-01]